MNEILWSNSLQTGQYLVHWGRSWRDGAPGVGTGNWRRGGIRGALKNKKLKVTKINNKREEERKKKKNKKNSSNTPKSDTAKATDAIREDTAYRKALAENQRIRNPKLSPDKLTTAATKFKDASKYMDDVSKGVSNAWNDLHNAKYRNKDRSKEVKDLSNAELQNVIARIKLEQEYNRITMPQKKSGYDKTMAALSVIGTAATMTATGLSIAAGVKALKKQ